MIASLRLAQLASLLALLAGCQPTSSSAPAHAAATPPPSIATTRVDSPALTRPAVVPTDKCLARTQYDLPAGRFDETAQQLAHATGCFIEADMAAVAAVPVAAVHGQLTLREALQMAIKGTRLVLVPGQPGQLKVVLRNS